MPRDGSNIYSQPFPDVVEDTTIESTVYNGFTNDVAADLNAPRPVVAGGTAATSADQALFNLAAEKSTQAVTNYDSHLWVPGSFRSAAAATGAPNANAFAGVCYINEALANPPTNQNVVVEARDAIDGILYIRRKVAGVWGAWMAQAGASADLDTTYVNVAGDTMTGMLVLPATVPTLATHATNKAYVDNHVRYDTAQTLTAAQKTQARSNIGLEGYVGRNRLINGTFAVAQRILTSITVVDNAYGADRWRALSEGASLQIFANVFDAASGSPYVGVQNTLNGTDKFGLFQVIEGKNCKDLRSKTVTFSAYIQPLSAARLGDFKMAILEWTGTEDATTADPISSWGASGTAPTLAANWTYKNTPTNLSVVDGFVTQYSVTATLGATFTNLAVMIWNDDKTYTASDNFSLMQVQLEAGSTVTPFEFRSYGQELALCQRYLHYRGGTHLFEAFGTGLCTSTTGGVVSMYFTPLRGVPTFIFGGLLSVHNSAGGALAVTSLTSSVMSANSAIFAFTVASGLVAGNATTLFANNDLTTRIGFAAEI